MKRLLLLLFCFSINILGNSNRSFNLNLDNDAGYSDKFYTNGMELEIELRDPDIYSDTGEIVGRSYEGEKYQYVKRYFFGQKLYTPSNIRLEVNKISKYERPYAGVLYGGYSSESYASSGDYLIKTYFIGMMGKGSLGELYQREYHDLIGSPDPRGWSKQIDEGVIFQYNLLYSPQNNIFFLGDNYKRGDYRFIYELGLGTLFLKAKASLLLRYGRILNDFEPHKARFGEAIDRGPFGLEETYFYINPNLIYNIHDTTYQGSIFGDESPFTVDINPVVFESKLGYILAWNRFSLEYCFTMQSTEAKKEEWRLDWHMYNSLNFKVYY